MAVIAHRRRGTAAGSRLRPSARPARRRPADPRRCAAIGCRRRARTGGRGRRARPPPTPGRRRWRPARPGCRRSGPVPASSTTTVGQIAAMSSAWWVDSTITGSPGRSDSSSRNRSRCSGSRPAVGSSRISSSGSAQQRLGDPQALPHPAGQGAYPGAGAAFQADGGQHPGHLLGAAAPVGDLLQDRHVVQESGDREVPVIAQLLGEVAEPPADLDPLRRLPRIEAEHRHPPRVGFADGGQDRQQRRLPRAVRAEQSGDPPFQRRDRPRPGPGWPRTAGTGRRRGQPRRARSGSSHPSRSRSGHGAPAAPRQRRTARRRTPAGRSAARSATERESSPAAAPAAPTAPPP